MITKVFGISATLGVRNLAIRNLARTSSNLCRLNITQREVFQCSIKSCLISKNFQIIKFSTENSHRKPIPSVQYNDIKELPNHPEKLLIDVRERQELEETGKIPTSINIPLDSVVRVLAEDVRPQMFLSKYGRRKPNFDDEIIFTCRLGKRALKAAEIANAMGFTNVKFYEGSWEDWANNEKKSNN
ncbi:rhodanese domain-containing protein CG4456 [Bactrocera oleae]|uniref:rhodanese domain-containing protein CG4456 n=1 Tax=Bactrocera oleae TaxID=104688 RepID=UPI0006B7F16B|nr:rhodanese domain-containing protein CG4456 [Bactrocera oleae]XP_036217166.1 rhodanese domain-containing protein CG4456 [Bactrocera oleae]